MRKIAVLAMLLGLTAMPAWAWLIQAPAGVVAAVAACGFPTLANGGMAVSIDGGNNITGAGC